MKRAASLSAAFALVVVALVSSMLLDVGAIRAQVDPSALGSVRKPKMPDTAQVRTQVHAEGRINLGGRVNSSFSELFPVITPDEMVLFFTRKGDTSNTGYAKNPADEDIWYSARERDGSWSNAAKLPGVLNTDQYDGVRAINSQATHLYLQNTYRENGTRGKGFSMSTKQPDGSWSFPDSLVIEDYYNNSSIAMMTVSNDEETIVFALVRKDSKGQHDLYVSRKVGERVYSRPEPIGELNTAGDEISPFIGFDDRTLYFSTDGRGGYGLHDVFITRRLDETWLHWTTPMNMGEPVNTASFDAYFTTTATGDTAYFSSAHETSSRGFGKSDLWKVALLPWQRPGFQLPTADWDKTGDPEADSLTNALFRLDKVLFDVDRATIRAQSKESLDTLAKTIKLFPNLAFQIQGHTDGDGDAAHNLELSQIRAEAVCKYLVEHGVSADQVSARGFGMTRPIAPNTTLRGKQLNRRVMVLVSKRIAVGQTSATPPQARNGH